LIHRFANRGKWLGYNPNEDRLNLQGLGLATIFSLHFPRTVYNDGTIKFQGKSYNLNQIPGRKVIVAFQPGRKLMALYNNEKIWQYHFEGYR